MDDGHATSYKDGIIVSKDGVYCGQSGCVREDTVTGDFLSLRVDYSLIRQRITESLSRGLGVLFPYAFNGLARDSRLFGLYDVDYVYGASKAAYVSRAWDSVVLSTSVGGFVGVFVRQILFSYRFRPYRRGEAASKGGIRRAFVLFRAYYNYAVRATISDRGVRTIFYVRACSVGPLFEDGLTGYFIVVCCYIMSQGDASRYQAFKYGFTTRTSNVSMKTRVRSNFYARFCY